MKPGYLSTLSAWRDTRGKADARKLVVLHMADCVGNGVYFSTFALYLNRHAGLGSWTIGVGLSVGAACGLLSNLLVGRVADSVGPRRILAFLLLALGAVCCALPLVSGLPSLLVFAMVFSAFHFSCAAPFVALIGAAFPGSDRARGRALIRSFGNVGMAVGAALSAGLLALAPTQFLTASPYVNAASFGLAGVIVATLGIGARNNDRAPRPAAARLHAVTLPGMPMMLLATSVLGLHSSLLAVGVPLWISITHLVPAWFIPVLIGLNTVLVVLLQVSAAEYAGKSFSSAVLASRIAGLIGAGACVVLAVSVWHRAHLVAFVTLIARFTLLTLMELLQNGATFFFGLNLGSDERRAEYASAFNVTEIVEGTAGPLLIGAVFARQAPWSWLIFAALIALAAGAYSQVAVKLRHIENVEVATA
jgi:MFS family permease